MSRMHTGKHGKSKSRKPSVEAGSVPEGTPSKEEIEALIIEYTKQGVSPTLIGQYLKDKHNVKYIKQVFGKRLGSVLKEKKLAGEFPPDLTDLLKKAINMRKHMSANHGDVHNKMRLIRVESKIWRLTKYYKKEGVLPENWKYDPEKIALIIKS